MPKMCNGLGRRNEEVFFLSFICFYTEQNYLLRCSYYTSIYLSIYLFIYLLLNENDRSSLHNEQNEVKCLYIWYIV